MFCYCFYFLLVNARQENILSSMKNISLCFFSISIYIFFWLFVLFLSVYLFFLSERHNLHRKALNKRTGFPTMQKRTRKRERIILKKLSYIHICKLFLSWCLTVQMFFLLSQWLVKTTWNATKSQTNYLVVKQRAIIIRLNSKNVRSVVHFVYRFNVKLVNSVIINY